jgi:hypothetical protein
MPKRMKTVDLKKRKGTRAIAPDRNLLEQQKIAAEELTVASL